jgi:hypothetical protein
MKPRLNDRRRAPLGKVSTDTKGSVGPDLEMVGTWHKPPFQS